MILLWLITILMGGGLLAWISQMSGKDLPRWVTLFTMLAGLIISCALWWQYRGSAFTTGTDGWLITYSVSWIPEFGISFSLALDGLSLLMLMLSFFLGVTAVLISWTEIQDKVGFFHFNLLWVLAGICGVFLTMDTFLLYFFWEVMIIPMYFLIGIWGHENKRYAAFKFFIYTQASGLLMLLSILALYFVHGAATGQYTYDYRLLLDTPMDPDTSRWIMLGFLVAFAVKLPVVPFHTWLPDAHSQAPTAGSVILAGLLLKTGAYGVLRFVIPLFPESSHEIAPWAMALGVLGILYGAILAFAQTDLKRLVAYTSVSHMGFVMLGAFSFNELALQGVVMQMITHGISTGALFLIAGLLSERIHTRDITRMGGFWQSMPRLGGISLVFVMASLGLPGLGNFVAEFLTLIGSWQANRTLTVLGAIGVVGATIYSLRIMQRVFYGPKSEIAEDKLPDLSGREKLIMVPMVVLIILLGLMPQFVLDTSRAAMTNILKSIPVINSDVPTATIKQGGDHDLR
ncbi:NADH-quinone oxidoreductase subunit M [Chryseolinea sp. T2]|uniref:NADH-quinone oxidoreductase subunit M n=1 Tax=Chryseolinea sp. T2 TaxID=3129255 RepID=UPI0030788E6E